VDAYPEIIDVQAVVNTSLPDEAEADRLYDEKKSSDQFGQMESMMRFIVYGSVENGMKIILSRKGFDSANGGIVSPIFEDGTMLSFPIPCNIDSDSYDELFYAGDSYSKILKDLKYKGQVQKCHLDPDLDQERRKTKIEEWFPAFGQIDAAASYLKNIGVKVGDVFLFFGNFHRVEIKNGTYKYMRGTGDFYKDRDLQVIWGYLQVGEIISESEEQQKIWWHPHSRKERVCNSTNVIFKASEKLSFDKTRSGAGLLCFDEKRVLTLKGSNKATWKMNVVYDSEHIYCTTRRKNGAKDTKKGLYYAGIWQELGLYESAACIEWAKNIMSGE